MKRRYVLGTALAAALALATPLAGAQGPGYGYGPGAGYGPGMMGGGYGPGMMGGYGRGAGPMAALNLTDEQQDKLFAIQEANRKKNWDTMSTMRSEMFRLQRMYNSESVDSKPLLEQQKKVDDLRRQMLASRLDMRKQMESLLTPEQKKQLRQLGPWWMREDVE